MKEIPIAVPDKESRDKLVSLVELMLDLRKREAAEVLPQSKAVVQRQIAALDRQIDSCVYTLYGLTQDDIMAVEGK